jgi:hypothetical protein
MEHYEKGGPNWVTGLLELPEHDIDELDQEDAVDTATLMAGYTPVSWQELDWEMN